MIITVYQVIETEDLNFFKEELTQEIKKIFETHDTPKRKWLRSQDVQGLLCIGAGTLHNFREKGILPYSKVGGMIFTTAGANRSAASQTLAIPPEYSGDTVTAYIAFIKADGSEVSDSSYISSAVVA